MERFIGKIAVVTGSSSGIGRAIAKELVKKGLIVVGLDKNLKTHQEITEEILENKDDHIGKFFQFKCDISNEPEIRDIFTKIKSQIGDEIAVLINNAGVIENQFELMDVEIDQFDHVFQTNAKGMLVCAKEAIKSMSANNIPGHIININSVVSIPEFNVTFVQLYAASKYAARIFSHALRRELSQKKSLIKISNISPGSVDTSMPQNFPLLLEVMKKMEFILAPEDIAKACVQVLDTPSHVQISEMTVIPIH